MGIFGRRIDIKDATKTTYSDEDLRKLDLNYRNEFQIDREKRIYTPFRKEMPRAWQSQVRDMAFEKILDSIFRDTAWDVSTDISVLHTVLAQEGLTEDDFEKMKQEAAQK